MVKSLKPIIEECSKKDLFSNDLINSKIGFTDTVEPNLVDVTNMLKKNKYTTSKDKLSIHKLLSESKNSVHKNKIECSGKKLNVDSKDVTTQVNPSNVL
jgi:hypothetical protein